MFDYSLSRFRRIGENKFGVRSNRFKLFATKAQSITEKTTISFMVSLTPSHMPRTKSSESYNPVGLTDTETNDETNDGVTTK